MRYARITLWMMTALVATACGGDAADGGAVDISLGWPDAVALVDDAGRDSVSGCLPGTCGENGVCAPVGGCDCDPKFAGERCERCAEGHSGYPDCAPDPCVGQPCGEFGECQADGTCVCFWEYDGARCDRCAEGFIGYPDCRQDPCRPDPCSGHGQCQSDGACVCHPGFAGDACERCADGHIEYPECNDDPCLPDPCSGNGFCKGGLCTCAPGFAGDDCGACADGYVNYPSCVEICEFLGCRGETPVCLPDEQRCVQCVEDGDCGPAAPWCREGVCLECLSDDDAAPPGFCQGVCALYPPRCIDGTWQCSTGPAWEAEEESCDGFDNDCDGEVDEGVCETCVVDEARLRENLFAKWDLDFDPACNAYLTTMISGSDYVAVVPADAAEPVGIYYGNANQNMGYALVDPDPASRRVVVTYSCCAQCACQAYNGVTLLHTCEAWEEDCACAGQTHCPGFRDFPFLQAGYGDTAISYNGARIVTPTALAAGPGNTYYVGNFQVRQCWGFGSCENCYPDEPDTWCTGELSPCCDDTPLGRLAEFTLPVGDQRSHWRVVHVFDGEHIAGIESGRDGSVYVVTWAGAGAGNLYRYDPVARRRSRIAHFEGTAYSVTQDRRTGELWVEVQASPKLRRFSEDGEPLALPEGVPSDPGYQGILVFGPDDRLYRLVGRTQQDSGLEVWPVR